MTKTPETLSQALHRVAIAHVERKAQEYIAQLESVVDAARKVAAQEGLSQIPEIHGLRDAIAKLDEMA